jgi:hypothetical protein
VAIHVGMPIPIPTPNAILSLMSSPSVLVVCAAGTVSTTTVENVVAEPSLFVLVTIFVVVMELMLETAVSFIKGASPVFAFDVAVVGVPVMDDTDDI